MSASLALYDKEHAAREKYTYYLCSVAGALFAYIAKDYTLKTPVDSHDKTTMLALYFLLVCFVSGLANIFCIIQGTSKNKDDVILVEEIDNFVRSKQKRKEGNIASTLRMKPFTRYPKAFQTACQKGLKTNMKEP